MKLSAYMFLATLCAATILACPNAEARIGGGRSFGGRPFMSKPFTKPLAPTAPGIARQPTAQGTQTSTPFFGGAGGLLGGLLAGSLIGSLFLGRGFSGGGFLDLLIILGLIYIAYRLFFRKKTERVSQTTSYANTTPPSSLTGFPTGWEALRSVPQERKPQTQNLPENFNEEEFLSGAKATYIRLNKSWDERNLEDISQFATPSFMKELERQYKEDPTPSETEIIYVKASIVEVKEEEELVSVYFSVLLREDKTQNAPNEIQEIWHFVRPQNGSWKLDGIQQVEDGPNV